MLPKAKRLTAVFAAIIVAVLSAMPVSAGIEHMIIHQPTTNEPYVTVTSPFSASYQWYIADLDDGEEFSSGTDITPVSTQTASALTATPDGKKYICEITWSDGAQKFTDVITNNYAITHHPSASEPYVTLNNVSGATFQWHQSDFNAVTVADTDSADTVAASTVYGGSYAGGMWHGTPDIAVDIEFELKKNQLLAVTPSADFDGTVEEYGEAFLKSQAGVYTYLATEDVDFNLCVKNAESFNVKVEIITFIGSTPVIGQTDNTLTLNADGAYYFCEITGNGNAKLTTPSFKYSLAITHQPDAKEPYIEINTAKSATYTWFETSVSTRKVVYGFENENEIEIYNLWVGSFTDGKWSSNASGVFEGQMFLRKGQTLHLALPDNFESGVGGLKFEDGVYSYTAETNENFYIYLKNPTPFEFEIYVSELKNEKIIAELSNSKFTLPVDGKTYRCSVLVDGVELSGDPFVNSYTVTHQPQENAPNVETNAQNSVSYQWYRLEKKLYDVVRFSDTENRIAPSHIYKGIFSDESWQSQNGRLDIELNLKKNDVILVRLLSDSKVSANVNETDMSFSGEAFTFIAPKNGLFNLIVASPYSSTNFTASVKVLRGVKASEFSDTDATLNSISNGGYMCTVTFADGTTADSDPIIITNGSLDALEKELNSLTETATEDDKEKITQLALVASELISADASETARIKAIKDSAADLLALIAQKSTAVTALASAVEEYDSNKLIPSDRIAVTSLKNDITSLLNGKNLSQSQKDSLAALLDICDGLLEKIEALNITVSIVNNPKTAQIKFGETLTLSASVTDMPENAKIAWYVDGELTAEGETFNFSPEKSSVVTVKIFDENGNVILDKDEEEISDSEQVDVKTNFFIKLINFFKKLFGINQTIVQTVI